jgi:hypothetical protein
MVLLVIEWYAGGGSPGERLTDGSANKEPPALVTPCNQNPRLLGASRP